MTETKKISEKLVGNWQGKPTPVSQETLSQGKFLRAGPGGGLGWDPGGGACGKRSAAVCGGVCEVGEGSLAR